MSDDTPDTHVDNAEPSMEDILASIRRIIADEDTGASVEVDLVDAAAPSESFTIIEAETESDVIEGGATASLLDDEVLTLVEADKPLNDDEMLSDTDLLLSDLDAGGEVDTMDLDILDIAPDSDSIKVATLTMFGAVAAAGLGAVASAGAAAADSLTVARSNPKPQIMNEAVDTLMENDLDFGDDDDNVMEALDLLLEEDDVSDVNKVLGFDVDKELNDLLTIPESEPEAVDDIEALLGDMLRDDNVEDDDIVTDERVIDPAEDLISGADDELDISDALIADLLADDDSFEEVNLPAGAQSSDDLDLVKSLMADLTDDPYDAAEDVVTADDEADLVDDILSLTMQDEVDLNEMSDLIDEADTTVEASEPFVIDIREDLSTSEAPTQPASRSSLADIAEAAQADAERMERRSGFAAAGFAAGAGIMVASAGPIAAAVAAVSGSEDITDALDDDITDNDNTSDIEMAEAETEITQDITLEQETADMPKAATKTDTIINEITEEATAGAFASLNQVVENQAVVADRGDRIGDLVTEALRPMLKEWLDKNLKGIVERAVTKEVKRISSGK